MEIVIVLLAQKKMGRRGIPTAWVEETIQNPAQTVPGYGGRVVYHRKYQVPGRKEQLLRVVCDKEPNRAVVVTAYLTSEIHRYWKE